MATLERAIELAARAHAGQRDKGGQPYILHPLRVMAAMTTDAGRIAAVLHDIVEDTSITFDDLVAEGFADDIVDAIRALTKFEGETREQAAKRIVRDPIARAVKLADIADNMDLTRIPAPSERDRARLREYAVAREILLAGPDAA
ncbi:HD domain-containing protein [Lysobacter hankyongensis]|uniref:HD domain-containing protein n=1 Tax=Lysobacter hankyongensis TaxID=1176535 RepID=A0ABP9BA92_9GAMM